MGAFRGAVEVGADALETDIHLSKDGVVLLSHVSLLKRSADVGILRLARTRTSSDALAEMRSSSTATTSF
jgi:glycerophosphoryl diester phosphodiesterase